MTWPPDRPRKPVSRELVVAALFAAMVLAAGLALGGPGVVAGQLHQQPTEFPTVPPTETVPPLPSDIPTPAADTPTPTVSPTSSPSPSPTPTRRVTPVSPTPTEAVLDTHIFLPRVLNGLVGPDPAVH